MRMGNNVLALIGGLFAGLLAGDVILHVAGFKFEFNPRIVGCEDVIRPVNVSDPDLLWVRNDYEQVLASLRRHPPDLVSLGCSCSYDGEYQRHLERMFSQETGRRIVYANVATIGWSSHQGLAQLKRDIWRLHPKIVTVFFGWNDHWRGFGVIDKQLSAYNRLFYRYRGMRFMQLLAKSWVASVDRRSKAPRVPKADFRRNLVEIVDLAREKGIVPVLITAPTPRRVNDRIASPGTAKEWDGAWLPLHREYASIVREVAGQRNVCLWDAAAEVDSLPPAVANELFPWDDIHFNTRGAELIARVIYRELKRAGLLDSLGWVSRA